MKAVNLVYFLLIIVFFSCKKENELDDVNPNNNYDVEIADYATLDNIRKDSCDTFLADIILKRQNLPENIDFTHVIVENRNTMIKRISNNFNNVELESNCDQSVEYYIYLYNIEIKKQTPPSVYTFIQ